MLDRDKLMNVVRMASVADERESDCDECFEQVDRFVEMELAGLDAAQAMPLVRDHLDKCGDCREEFEALLEALRASEAGPLDRLWRKLRGG